MTFLARVLGSRIVLVMLLVVAFAGCTDRPQAVARDASSDGTVRFDSTIFEAGGAKHCFDPSGAGCSGSDVCDAISGACVDGRTPGILTGAAQECGNGGPTCFPGSECSIGNLCQPAAPCSSIACNSNNSVCWGASCQATRAEPRCTPASLARMNQDDFVAGTMPGTAIDLEFDDLCNAYAVTILNGTDYLRELSPSGQLTVSDGVANLNMGEVAAYRLQQGEFPSPGDPVSVGLTYICCAECGCTSDARQGVARFAKNQAVALPLVVPAIFTDGQGGPWMVDGLNSGPAGLTWTTRQQLFVGNVQTNGDLVRADLDTGMIQNIATFAQRVYASAPFDEGSILVALADNQIVRMNTSNGQHRMWGTSAEPVLSMVRDSFNGQVYISLRDGSVQRYSSLGERLGQLSEPSAGGSRVALAPDGFLYRLTVVPGFQIGTSPMRPSIEKIALPQSL